MELSARLVHRDCSISGSIIRHVPIRLLRLPRRRPQSSELKHTDANTVISANVPIICHDSRQRSVKRNLPK